MRLSYGYASLMVVGLLLLALGHVGCGESDSGFSISIPTPTPAPEGPELHFGATARGSGALALASDDDLTVKVPFNRCLGGTGSSCTGGLLLYLASDPGFPTIEMDAPAQPLYTLNAGTQVSLMVVAIDQGVSLMFGDATLSAVGDSSVLGTAPLHADGSWEILVAGGTTPANHSVTLQLTTTSSVYTASTPFTITLVPTAAEGG